MLAVLHVEGQEKRSKIGKRGDKPAIFTDIDSGKPKSRPFVIKKCRK